MCGENDAEFLVQIEGAQMNVCGKCKAYGTVMKRAGPTFTRPAAPISSRPSPMPPQKERLLIIKEDFAEKIRSAREKMNVTQKDFAQQLNEKESVVHGLETGKHEPNISLARKLEKMLRISLVEETEVEATHMQATTDEVTIGDFVKIKKR